MRPWHNRCNPGLSPTTGSGYAVPQLGRFFPSITMGYRTTVRLMLVLRTVAARGDHASRC
jgi:hypothetical protein